ncbi:MAG: hypothetical protein GDA56_05930 [Hormoscilla sp. GM7CHS1pb]|nr:hypothetical protein [Hormoscilla sp. GM7CHS1pb]
MKTIETIATVNADRKITLQLPPEISPGEHQIRLAIGEKLVAEKPTTNKERPPLDFPAITVGTWPADLSLRREDMY